MDLKTLQVLGVLSIAGWEKTSVEWACKVNGEPVAGFDVFIKREPSAADWEFINIQGLARADDDTNVMARRVHRLVRLGDAGDEVIPFDTACQFKPGFLLALCTAINRVQKPAEPPPKA